MRLSEADKREIKELYDGSFASVRELADIFGVCHESIAYIVDHNGMKAKHDRYVMNWQAKNREKVRESGRKYYQNNKDKIREYRNWWQQNLMTTEQKIAKNLRDRLRRSLKRNSKRGSAVGDLGCSIKEFKISESFVPLNKGLHCFPNAIAASCSFTKWVSKKSLLKRYVTNNSLSLNDIILLIYPSSPPS